MAQTTYVSKQAVTLQNRSAAYYQVSQALLHFDTFNLNLISIIRRGDNFIEVTLSNPLPPEQIDHLGLV